MNLYETLSIINLIVLFGIIVFLCFRKNKKAVIYNVVVLALFLLVNFVQANYDEIRAYLFNLLGETHFEIFRDILSITMFFGSSVAIGVQIIARIVCFVIFIFLAANAAKLLSCKFIKKAFSNTVSSKNEKVQSVNVYISNKVFLLYRRLLN